MSIMLYMLYFYCDMYDTVCILFFIIVTCIMYCAAVSATCSSTSTENEKT